ncbi:MAG: hypothetical protein SO022_12410 [Selenomonadaceae bacterium]|nr:hypothetical protein [Selenomonadaceae bacterium]
MIKNYEKIKKQHIVRIKGHKSMVHHIQPEEALLIKPVSFIEKDSTGKEICVPIKFCDIKLLQQYLIKNGFFPIPIHNHSIIHALISRVYYKNNNSSNIDTLIFDIFKHDFWNSNLETWKSIKEFNDYGQLTNTPKVAIDLYNQKYYYESNILSVSLWEPIFRMILLKKNCYVPYHQKSIKENVFDLMKTVDNSDVIIEYLDKYSWANTNNAPIDISHPMRHDTAHKCEREVNQKTALNSLFIVYYLLYILQITKSDIPHKSIQR